MFHNGRRNDSSETAPLLSRRSQDRSTSRRNHPHKDEKTTPTSSAHRSQGAAKLGTFGGVFVPTALNVLSILMFLRFGFILGQAGLIGFLGMLLACYLINLVTTMSISAIASNGTVRGGGAYYLISRSLGPEFGGSIGLVLYIGFVFNTGMNSVGLIDCLVSDFGTKSGTMGNWLPEEYTWRYLWGSIVLVLCTLICLAGSGLFARCSNALLLVLLISTFSIPLSTFFKEPFWKPELHQHYTGLSLQTFRDNLLPKFTKGASGSQLSTRENFQDLFGILFPATGGIFAGASMSGDLRDPSRSIPRGTLYGLVLTFISYLTVIFAMAASITRGSLYRNSNIIQDVNMSEALILLGELSTCIFSVLMGVIGSAKLLQALARDRLLPGLIVFGQGAKKSDEPIVAIIFTYAISQLTMLADINKIASLVTMAYLMTFLVTNLACFLLKISSAPNFRPSFHYFSSWTAALGAILSGITMFFVDTVYASACIIVIMVLFITIHYTTAPKSWGDVSQSLIYHQVRKYLLRLRQEHVKFWRPQILLFVNDPRKSFKLIQFCNSLKKGSLFILGHIIVAQDFATAVPEAKKQQVTWLSYIDFSKIKAFVNVVISPGIEWGARNVVLSAGLGGMRPNIIMFGFYNLDEYRESFPAYKLAKLAEVNRSSRPSTPSKHHRRKGTMDIRMSGELPTDSNRPEKAVSASAYLTILEDLVLQLKLNVAVAHGFQNLELPNSRGSWSERLQELFRFRHEADHSDEDWKSYIDLWPIQMSANITTQDGEGIRALLTTNFDTYALILQLGCILHTVDSWKHAYKLRVAVFVEYESDVEEERGRVKTLLSNLRIEAEVLVFWLACGELKTYEIIVNGNYSGRNAEAAELVDTLLRDDEWWQGVKESRERGMTVQSNALESGGCSIADVAAAPEIMTINNQQVSGTENGPSFERLLKSAQKRRSAANLNRLGVSLTMQTHRLDPDFLDYETDGESGRFIHREGLPSSSSSSFSEEESQDQITSDDDDDDYDKSSGTDTSSYREPIRGGRRRRSAGGRTEGIRGRTIQGHDSEAREYESSERHEEEEEEEREGEEGEEEEEEESVSQTALRLRRTSSTSAIVKSLETKQASNVSFALPSAPGTPSQNEGVSTATNKASPKLIRPSVSRHASFPRLSSSLVPRTTVATEEGVWPSIMFDVASPPRHDSHHRSGGPSQSIYTRGGRAGGRSESRRTRRSASSVSRQSMESDRSGFTSFSAMSAASSQALTFNNLPSRAQHLILNELMNLHSSGPVSEEDSASAETSSVETGSIQPPAAQTEDPEPARATSTAVPASALGRPRANYKTSDASGSGSNNNTNGSGSHNNTSARDAHATLKANRSDSDTTRTGVKGGNTAVIFTTLQAPLAGTHLSEEDSLRYLEDVETLCLGLPPVLMVHSNSVSVTMSL